MKISIATQEDDELLRECVKNNEMKGSISVNFESEPSFFDSISVQGRESQVIVGKTEKGELIGFGIRSIKPVYINGEISDVGYLSGLRVNTEFRNSSFLARGYNFLRDLDMDGRVPFYLTTIIEDNENAQNVLESGRGGLPQYIPIDTLSTFVISLGGRKTSHRHEIVRGVDVTLDDILRFMEDEGGKKQFYPHYDTSDFDSPRLRGLRREDFYVAIDKGEIVGVVAKWDQETFKQTRVVGYDGITRIARPLINMVSRFSKIPRLPKVESLLHHFHAAFPTTKDNDPIILESLLENLSSDPENKDYDYFTLGITENDPLTEAVRTFSPREYRAKMYVVSFEEEKPDLTFLNEVVPYLELGTL